MFDSAISKKFSIALMFICVFLTSCSGSQESIKNTTTPPPPTIIKGNIIVMTGLSWPISIVKIDLIDSNGVKITKYGSMTVEFKDLLPGIFELMPSETVKDQFGEMIISSFWKRKISVSAGETVYIDGLVTGVPWNQGWIRIDAGGLSDHANINLTIKRSGDSNPIENNKKFFKYSNIVPVYSFTYQIDFAPAEGKFPHPPSVLVQAATGQGVTATTSYY